MAKRKAAIHIDDWGQFLSTDDQEVFHKLNHEIALLEKHIKEKMIARRKLRTKAQHAARSVALHKLAADLKKPEPVADEHVTHEAIEQPDMFEPAAE